MLWLNGRTPGFSWPSLGAALPQPALPYGTGPGQIPLHLSAPRSSAFSFLKNQGGAAEPFDATVSSGSLTTDAEAMIDFRSTGPWLAMANALPITDARLMFVLNPTYTNGRLFMGNPTDTAILMSSNTTDWRLQIRRVVNGSPVMAQGTLIPQVANKKWLVEFEITPTTLTNMLDLNTTMSIANPWTGMSWPLSLIGRGYYGSPNDGFIGDVMVVQRGGDYAASVQKARAHLNAKHRLGLTL